MSNDIDNNDKKEASRQKLELYQRLFKPVKSSKKKLVRPLSAKESALDDEITEKIESAEDASSKSELARDSIIASLADRLHSNLGWLSLVLTVLAIPLNMYKTVHAIAISREHTGSRFTKALMGLGGIALGALSACVVIGVVYISSAILMMASVAKSFVENIYHLGTAIYDRFNKKSRAESKEIKSLINKLEKPFNEPDLKRLTQLNNKRTKQNEAIAHRTHSLVQAGIALLGAVLLFTPAAPVGVGILIGIGAYGLADTFGLNPFKWALRGINAISKKWRGKPLFEPFVQKTALEVGNELNKVDLPKTDPVCEKSSEAKIDSRLAEVTHVRPADFAENHLKDVVSGLDNNKPSSVTTTISSIQSNEATNGNKKANHKSSETDDDSKGDSEHPHARV